MVAYSFQKRFVPLIETDRKLQTVRAQRKRHARPGEELQLYQGMRTRHCRLIGRRRCISVDPIVIIPACDEIFVGETSCFEAAGAAGHYILNDEKTPMKPVDVDKFAVLDGFKGWRSMKVFWLDAHPDAADPEKCFVGVVIRWQSAGPSTSIETADPMHLELKELGLA